MNHNDLAIYSLFPNGNVSGLTASNEWILTKVMHWIGI